METMGLEPTTPCLQSRSEAVRTLPMRAVICRRVSPSVTRKSRSAWVQPSGGVLTSAASTGTVGIRGEDVCGYVAGYVLADTRPKKVE